jgi:thiamine kinase-like enzyme
VLDRLEARPSTLCHLDAFRKNLFDRAGETVAIDWSYVGTAPIGVEIGQLVMGSVAFAEHGHDPHALAAASLDAYVAGLRDSGWNGDEDAVRDGFALAAIRWVFMLGWLGSVLDPARQAQMEKWAGQPLADQVADAGARTTYLLDLIDGALV